MSLFNVYPKEQRPIVVLFSGPNALAIYIVESLLTNFCRVEIVSNQARTWERSLDHVRTKDLITFSKETNLDKKTFDYSIFVDFSKKDFDFPGAGNKKCFIIKPYKDVGLFSSLVKIPDTAGIIFVGDLIGPRMDLIKGDTISTLILNQLSKKKINFTRDEILYPVFLGDVARQITKWLFSFGPYGKKVMLLANEIKLSELVSIKGRSAEETIFPDEVERYNLNRDFRKIFKETVAWFAQKKGSLNLREEEDKKKRPLKVIYSLLVLFVVLSPYLFLLFSGGMLALAQKRILEKSLPVTKSLLYLANTTSTISWRESTIASKVPLVKIIYRPALSAAKIVKDTSSIGLRGVTMVQKAASLVEKIINSSPYDVTSFSRDIGAEVEAAYSEASFLEGEIKALKVKGGQQLGDLKKYLLEAKILVSQLPELLGGEKKKVYLVLLQNNMELRPTGGFIGSFALVTFDGGKITDLTVQDVYSADGQLKGHVEPPAAIKDYLKEANWYLRDSNWDPDFTVAAQRAEWFLDKEADIAVDGVVAIDLDLVKDLLKVTGPIFLKDFDTELSAENFYEKTQGEVEKDFFPGSYRKSGFLTAVTKALSERFTASLGESTLAVFQTFLDNLEKKHVQVYLHNQPAQKTMANLGWNGAVVTPWCPENCYRDWFGFVEANVGVNKANYYLTRSYLLNLKIDKEGKIAKSLTINLINSANQALGPKAIYKNYARILVPAGAVVNKVLVNNGTLLEDVPFDKEIVANRQEAGFYFEVSPGQTRTVFVEWNNEKSLDFTKPGEYRLLWRKQAGLGDSPISYNLESDQPLTLIREDGYNAVLSKDSISRILWTNKPY